MAIERWSGFPTAGAEGYRSWATGEVPTAAEFNADRSDVIAITSSSHVTGALSTFTATAAGLVVTIPDGASWYCKFPFRCNGDTTITVPDNSDSWIFACADGELRVSSSANPPDGWSNSDSCLLCKVSAAGGNATVINGERWYARRVDANRVVTDGAIAISQSQVTLDGMLVFDPAVPETPTDRIALFAQSVSGQPELHVIDSAGRTVQLTSQGQVLAAEYLRLDGTNVLRGSLLLGDSGDDSGVIIIRAPDLVVGPGPHYGALTVEEFDGGEAYYNTRLVYIDAYDSFHRLTDNLGLVPPGAATGIYGAGSDGALVFDGVNPVLDITPSGGVYTLTRSIYPSQVTIQAGVTVVCNSREIICSGNVLIEGSLTANGGNGADGTQIGGAGLGGSAISAGDVGGSQAGSAGGAGNTGAGSAAGAVTGHQNCLIGAVTGGAGGAGGNGSSGSGGASGSGGVATYRPYRRYTGHIIAGDTLLTGGPGGRGGGGGGGDGTNKGGGGGGGGAGGGIIHLAARKVTVNATGLLSATGGNGGDGGSPTTGNAGGGGGGGGGSGGAIILVAEVLEIAPGTLTVAGGAGGIGGTASGTGTNGVAGTNGPAGKIIQFASRTGFFEIT